MVIIWFGRTSNIKNIMIHIYESISLLPYHTFHIDVLADMLVEYDTIEDLQEILRNPNQYPAPFLHVGSGSNLLFTQDFHGTILHSKMQHIHVANETEDTIDLLVDSGLDWDVFVAYCVNKGWYGVENLSFIPGEVGASAVQNIGAYGVEACQLIQEVHALETATGDACVFSADECQYGYRQSLFKQPGVRGKYIVTHVLYRLSKKRIVHLEYGSIQAHLSLLGVGVDTASLQQIRDVIIDIRKDKLPDPDILGNAGSFFMNPIVSEETFQRMYSDSPTMPFYRISDDRVKIPAGWMIDQCGWKGRSIGHAAVHKDQALVLVNLGCATSAEIVNLAEEVRAAVFERFGISIYPEVLYI